MSRQHSRNPIPGLGFDGEDAALARSLIAHGMRGKKLSPDALLKTFKWWDANKTKQWHTPEAAAADLAGFIGEEQADVVANWREHVVEHGPDHYAPWNVSGLPDEKIDARLDELTKHSAENSRQHDWLLQLEALDLQTEKTAREQGNAAEQKTARVDDAVEQTGSYAEVVREKRKIEDFMKADYPAYRADKEMQTTYARLVEAELAVNDANFGMASPSDYNNSEPSTNWRDHETPLTNEGE